MSQYYNLGIDINVTQILFGDDELFCTMVVTYADYMAYALSPPILILLLIPYIRFVSLPWSSGEACDTPVFVTFNNFGYQPDIVMSFLSSIHRCLF